MASEKERTTQGLGDQASSERTGATARLAPEQADASVQAKQKQAKQKQENPLLKLLSFAGERKVLTYVGLALSGISQVLAFGPYICVWFVARDLIEVAPNWQAATNIATYGWWALGLAVASIVVYFAALMCTHLSAFRCATNMRKQASEHLMHLPLGYFDTHATGELRRVIDGCAASTETLLAHMMPDTVGSVVMVVGMLVLMFVADWRLGLACIVSIVVSFAALAKMMGGESMKLMEEYQNASVRMNKTGTEYVRGIPVLKVFQQTIYSFRTFHEAIKNYAHMSQSYAGDFCRAPQVTNLTALNGLVVFLLPVALLLAPGEADFAHFAINFAFYAIFSAIVPTAMTKVMFMGEATQIAGDAYGRVSSILSAAELPVTATPEHPHDNSLVFDQVSFTYEGAETPALEDVSFAVPAGATVALVGPSGGGKSTCASLIPRFWDATSGSVKVGGVDVCNMDPHELMDQVAFVFQTNQLFTQSLADNVRAARPEASDTQVLAALAAAQCDDIVAKLPRGIHTQLGTGGAYLSGGEVQRVALARAILKDAPIVVLDEATAFADPENEALIQKAFTRLAEGRTVVMIAHRLSTVVNADNIVVLDRGHVVEQGKHADLVNGGGLYARMWADYEQSVNWKIARDGQAGSLQSGLLQGEAAGSAGVAAARTVPVKAAPASAAAKAAPASAKVAATPVKVATTPHVSAPKGGVA